ncbi:MAG: regulatory protein RecX [Draconibacterium sp.]
MENHESTAREAFMKMAQLCSRSEQCSADIKKKIAAYDIVEEVVEEIIARLKSEKFLDDDRYVHAYISDKIRLNKWGRIKMRYYLKAKGLPDAVIERGLNEIDAEQYKKVLLATMNEKAKKVKKENKYEQAAHVIRFAQSRGFEPELIHRHLNEVLK